MCFERAAPPHRQPVWRLFLFEPSICRHRIRPCKQQTRSMLANRVDLDFEFVPSPDLYLA